jgi:hypothetical protein
MTRFCGLIEAHGRVKCKKRSSLSTGFHKIGMADCLLNVRFLPQRPCSRHARQVRVGPLDDLSRVVLVEFKRYLHAHPACANNHSGPT